MSNAHNGEWMKAFWQGYRDCAGQIKRIGIAKELPVKTHTAYNRGWKLKLDRVNTNWAEKRKEV